MVTFRYNSNSNTPAKKKDCPGCGLLFKVKGTKHRHKVGLNRVYTDSKLYYLFKHTPLSFCATMDEQVWTRWVQCLLIKRSETWFLWVLSQRVSHSVHYSSLFSLRMFLSERRCSLPRIWITWNWRGALKCSQTHYKNLFICKVQVARVRDVVQTLTAP